MFKSKLILQIAVASIAATLATALIVSAATTIGNNISTDGTLGVTGKATLGNASTTQMSVSGISYLGTVNSGTWNGSAISAAYGGTGSTTLSGILKGNGAGAVATAVSDTDFLLPATAASTYAPLASPTFTGLTTLANASSTQLTTTSSTYLATLGGRVGIGTTNPSTLLNVADMFTVNSSTKRINIGSDAEGSSLLNIWYEDPNTDSKAQNIRLGGKAALGETWLSASTVLGNNVLAYNSYMVLQRAAAGAAITVDDGDGITFHTTTVSGAAGDTFSSPRMTIDTTGRVGVGTTTPASLLHVSAGTNATTTVEFGAQSVTSKTCFNVRDALGAATSFYFVGTAMVVEPNRCR